MKLWMPIFKSQNGDFIFGRFIINAIDLDEANMIAMQKMEKCGYDNPNMVGDPNSLFSHCIKLVSTSVIAFLPY